MRRGQSVLDKENHLYKRNFFSSARLVAAITKRAAHVVGNDDDGDQDADADDDFGARGQIVALDLRDVRIGNGDCRIRFQISDDKRFISDGADIAALA